jgi:hypothetical protein
MVSRRLTIFRAFEENRHLFINKEFQQRFWRINVKGKSVLSEDNITPSIIFSFINDNYNLWEEAVKIDTEYEDKQGIEETSSEIKREYQDVVIRNEITLISPLRSQFMKKLLANATNKKIPYPAFEKQVLFRFEGILNIKGKKLIEEASKVFLLSVYKVDEIKSHRLLFEEFNKFNQQYETLGIIFNYPEFSLSREGNVSQIMEAVHVASVLAGGVNGLRRIISLANKIGEVSFTEEEMKNFFASYLSGGIDSTLLNPPHNLTYFIEVEKTHDYDFTTKLDQLIPKTKCTPEEMEILFNKLLNVLMRVKIVEWSKNVPLGEETIILDLISEIQRKVLKIVSEDEDLLSFQDMFQRSSKNILNTTINYFSEKLAYSYLLRVRKGGVGKTLLNSFKMMNLTGSSRKLGFQLIDIRKYYQVLHPFSWKKEFYDDFIIDIASRGLSSTPKQTLRERVKLLVMEDPSFSRPSSIFSSEKIKSDMISKSLKLNVPRLSPDFSTAEHAQDYLIKTFSIIKSVLNKVWIKKIIRKGFELYVETPVTRGWTDEMEDLSRELIAYYQNLVIGLNQSPLIINSLIFESLRESLSGLYFIDDFSRDYEVFEIFLQLPENPKLLDRESVDKYLEYAFQFGKIIINKVLGRKVEEEYERKTFNQEIEERISLENRVIDWFIRASQYYNSIITEPISLEKTMNPNDILLKTIYGGTIYLVEESMKALTLNKNEKLNKASFLKILIYKQVEAFRRIFSQLKFDYNVQTFINYVLQQIKLWDKVFKIRGILTDLETDNRIQKAISNDKESSSSVIWVPGIRGLIARELIIEWIRNWANSVINLAESYLEDVLPKVDNQENFEQEVLGLLFEGTGRDDIRNFMVPLIVGNLRESLGFETSHLSSEFMNYSHEVFTEAVMCDAQLSMYFLYLNWPNIENERNQHKKVMTGDLDFIIYQESQIESCNRLLGTAQEFSLSDIVKKATGLSLSGLTLQTVVFQLSEKEVFSAASYTENPFEGSVVTGLSLEIISKENISMGTIHPLARNASEVIAGLIERNELNASKPDPLFKNVLQQLLDEARLVLLKDAGNLREKMLPEMVSQEIRDVSRCNLFVTTAYKMYLKQYLPESIEFYGKELVNFGLFVQLLFPFFEPSQTIKERLKSDLHLMDYLEISNEEDLQVFPSLIVFDDNGKYKVVFGTYSRLENALYILIAEENIESTMGLRTIQYLLKTRNFEELAKDLGLISLPELSQSLPLNRINVLKEKRGISILDFELIKNISLGAI